MQVKELITALTKMDPEMKVFVYEEDAFVPVQQVTTQRSADESAEVVRLVGDIGYFIDRHKR